jgi:hypothetical protein
MKKTLKYFTFGIILASLSITSFQKVLSQNFSQTFYNIEGSSDGLVSWIDINNDDLLDLFVSGGSVLKPAFCTYYINTAGLNFSPSNILFPPVSHGAYDWGDFDNDGDLDLLLTGTLNSQGTQLICHIFKNNLNNGFSIHSANIVPIYKGVAKWIDYDNDGDLDIFMSGLNSSQNIIANIYTNNKFNNFTPLTHNLTALYGGSSIICDIDKDMDMDILITGKKSTAINDETKTLLYLNTSKSSFKAMDIGLPEVYDSYMSWGDFNGDGNSDLILNGLKKENGSFYESITKIFKNNGSYNFTNIGAGIEGIYKGVSLWGDCDNDGHLDFLLSGGILSDTGSFMKKVTKVYLNRNNSFIELVNSPFSSLSNTSAALGDYDKDSDLDLLIAGVDNNQNEVTKIYNNMCDIPNSIPIEPKGLTTSIDHGYETDIVLQWLPGQDDNTPVKSLTYNLRVGTTPGGIDIVSPKSNPSTGYLKMPVRGNVDNNTSWRLTQLEPGTYYWSIQTIDNSYNGSDFSPEQSFTIKSSVGITQIGSGIPDAFDLQQNYPNPFNPSTKIRFALPSASNVLMTVYNSAGQKVYDILNENYNAGIYEVTWNGKSYSGQPLSSGVYFYTIDTKFGRLTKKMLLVK